MMYYDEQFIASGTCFFVKSAKGISLITNRHNFTGRDNFTNKPLSKTGAIPNNAVVAIPSIAGRVQYRIDLRNQLNENADAWVEHPRLLAKADIVALPCNELKNIIFEDKYIDLGEQQYSLQVGMELQVIGFPFGAISGPFAVWSKGFIATEPDVDVSDLPVYLIDVRSRPGQSGSPVFLYFKKGQIENLQGDIVVAKEHIFILVGVYSGRIRNDSDLGIVWKKEVVRELVAHADVVGVQHEMEKCKFKSLIIWPDFSFQTSI